MPDTRVTKEMVEAGARAAFAIHDDLNEGFESLPGSRQTWWRAEAGEAIKAAYPLIEERLKAERDAQVAALREAIVLVLGDLGDGGTAFLNVPRAIATLQRALSAAPAPDARVGEPWCYDMSAAPQDGSWVIAVDKFDNAYALHWNAKQARWTTKGEVSCGIRFDAFQRWVLLRATLAPQGEQEGRG